MTPGRAGWRAEARRPLVVVAAAIAVVTVLLTAMGTLTYLEGHVDVGPLPLAPFDLDREWTVPALWSALLMLAAAGAALSRGATAALGRRASFAIAAFFAFMAIDEYFALHEHVEVWLAVDWQLLYLPVIAVGGIAWLAVLRNMRGVARWLWLSGAACWFVAQVLEWWQWGPGDILIHPWMILPEEPLEMLGTASWLLALLAFSERFRVERRTAPTGQRDS